MAPRKLVGRRMPVLDRMRGDENDRVFGNMLIQIAIANDGQRARLFRPSNGFDRYAGSAHVGRAEMERRTETYVGSTDVMDGKGEQRVHYHNVHTNGDTSFGTFGARVSIGPDAAMTVEGEWRFTGGTGSLSKLRGGGIFKAQMTSPTSSEMTWSGSYEIGWRRLINHEVVPGIQEDPLFWNASGTGFTHWRDGGLGKWPMEGSRSA